MSVLVDEIEAHLHPQWQRTALAALLEVGKELDQELDIQFFVASHSPLVMASLEAVFDKDRDALFHLRMADEGDDVKIEEINFYPYGTIDAWLTSDLFGLKQSSSKERELAIGKAKDLQEKKEPTKEEIAEVFDELKEHLSEHDEFWPLWLYFAEKHGVKI